MTGCARREEFGMGINFVIANVCKRQFIDPTLLLDNSKSTGYLKGLHPRVVMALCCNNVASIGVYGGDWIGSWFGDPVYVIGDGSSQPELPGLDDRADRSLWGLVTDAFEDLSYPILADLCASDAELCSSLAARAVAGHGLAHLSNVVHLIGCDPLRAALQSAYGGGGAGRGRR